LSKMWRMVGLPSSFLRITLIRDEELLSWLETGDVLVFPAAGVVRECDAAPSSASFTGSGPIREVERTPMRLVWSTEDDAFARYIIHCVCRWHSVVSYSTFTWASAKRRSLC